MEKKILALRGTEKSVTKIFIGQKENKMPLGHYAHQNSGGHCPLAAMYFYKPWLPQP